MYRMSLAIVVFVLCTMQVPAIQQKRTVAFLNQFVVHTVQFLNRFSTVCEEVSKYTLYYLGEGGGCMLQTGFALLANSQLCGV